MRRLLCRPVGSLAIIVGLQGFGPAGQHPWLLAVAPLGLKPESLGSQLDAIPTAAFSLALSTLG
jgi:hypothetical protein